MTTTFFDALAAQLADFLAPLLDAVEDPYWLSSFLDALGTAPDDPAGASLASALEEVVGAVQEVKAIAVTPSPSFAEIASLLESVRKAILALRSLDSPGQVTEGLAGIGNDLIDLLIGIYVAGKSPLLYQLAVLLTVVDAPEDIIPTAPVLANGKMVRAPILLPRFHPDRLVALFQDPAALLKSQYLNPLATDADANAMADKLFRRLRGLLRVLNVLCKYGVTPEELPLMGDGAPYVDHTLTVWVTEELLGATEDAGLAFALCPASRGDLGLVISPFGALQYTKQVGGWAIELDFTAGVEALAIGRRGPIIAASAATASIEGKLSAALATPDSGPAFVLGSAKGTRLEVGGAKFLTTLMVEAGRFDYSVSGDVSSSAIVLSAGDSDGFLKSVLPPDGLKAKFDLGVIWSNTGGLAFRGAASLEAVIPTNISVGGVVQIPRLYIGFEADTNNGLTAEASLAVSVSIGPVTALIDHVGLLAIATFPASGGNLGPADFFFTFKPPSGVGLAVDAAGVSGGGFLRYVDAKHEYSGGLQLEFTDLALQAFGLLSTPATGTGYSLLAMIDADFPPVQLGWGFTLSGVGGLLAVNRAASTDALRAALKADALSSILFPQNAITNAPVILAQLDALFPAAPGRFLFGPMALIGWGTPTMLTAALAVIVELPEPVRIIVLARVAARIPSESEALVRINMDALGVLDLGRGEFSLDATLFDSRMLGFALSGDMALRAAWVTQREFLLAIGGFHPQFAPPAGFPSLQRVTIDMSSGAIRKLRLEAYLAVTSNALQFGANLDVFIGVSSFGLSGHLGFDALLQRDPFHFDADISGSVALTAGGDDLMSVHLDATLSGPAPWNIAGSFKIHIVFFDVHKSFSDSWGGDAPPQQITAVDVLSLLSAELADTKSWGTQLPPGTAALVSLRSQDESAVIAHPLARLEVHERTVPLGLQITRFGSAGLAGGNSFTITGYRINGTAVPHESVQDDFAPAQFFDLSDDEKLARPSFEQHDAGVRMGGGLVVNGPPATKTISYETYYIDEPGGGLRPDPVAPAQAALLIELQEILNIGSAARGEIWKAGNRRYAAPGKPVSVSPQFFTVADNSTLVSAGIGPEGGATYSDVKALLDAELSRDPSRRGQMEIVAMHEVPVA